jgi:hypothetical protein
MTVPVPSYVRGRPLQWLWVKYWRLQCLIHSYKRNPNCNERRRYKDDTIFIAGTHKHLPPIWQTSVTSFRSGKRSSAVLPDRDPIYPQ